MPNILKATQFGNPILRQKARRLSGDEILSDDIQTLISDMRHTLTARKYGVGLAAPQVGVGVALSIIGIKPTPTRPDLQPFEGVIINPEIIQTFGRKTSLWEGCISCGRGLSSLFAKVPRYKKIKLRWYDEQGIKHEQIVENFVAHVAQHEVDHLNGILFVDKVKDTTSYMMGSEYKKRIVQAMRKL